MGAVRAGLGVALIEPLTPAGAPLQDLVVRPIDVALPFRYGAISRISVTLPQPMQDLVETLSTLLIETVPGLRLAELADDELPVTDSKPLELGA